MYLGNCLWTDYLKGIWQVWRERGRVEKEISGGRGQGARLRYVTLIPQMNGVFTEDYSVPLDTLKKQSEAQAREYDRLATEYNKATGSISDKRKD